MTPRMGRDLGIFQHRVVRRIRGRHPEQRVDGNWEYPPLNTAMEEEGFDQKTVAHYIVTRPILNLCEERVRRSGARVARRWWEN